MYILHMYVFYENIYVKIIGAFLLLCDQCNCTEKNLRRGRCSYLFISVLVSNNSKMFSFGMRWRLMAIRHRFFFTIFGSNLVHSQKILQVTIGSYPPTLSDITSYSQQQYENFVFDNYRVASLLKSLKLFLCLKPGYKMYNLFPTSLNI